jgi:hypothetical protein
VPPTSVMAAAVWPIVPDRTELPSSVVRAAVATAAPSAAKRLAIAAPMPLLAPVTMAALLLA